MRLTHDQLERDHCDLLWLMDQLLPGSIHRDSRCTRMPPPHVLTVDCYPRPGERTEPGPCTGPGCDHVSHVDPPPVRS